MRCPSITPRFSPRRAVTSVIAMMYLVLFACMAVGFYSASGTAVEVSQNEQEQVKALGAAESGMDFLRFQVGTVIIPPSSTGATMMNTVYTQLASQLDP